MDKHEYLDHIQRLIDSKLENRRLQNFYYQTFATKMGADFFQTYDEKLLWNSALQLTTLSSQVLDNEPKYTCANNALYFAAQIYETFSEVSVSYDKHFCMVLAALCYDISGYQANALCLTREIYKLNDIEDDLGRLENCYLELVQLFLQKKLGKMQKMIPLYAGILETTRLEEADRKPFLEFFTAMDNLCVYLLTGSESKIAEHLQLATQGFFFNGNILFSRVNQLMETRYKLLRTQSIWDVISQEGKLRGNIYGQSIWLRYVKILSQNMYSGTRFCSEQERTSIFEFWKSQIEAIKAGIISDCNQSFIIQMPTSAGKTLIAELAILNILIEKPLSKCIYIAPYKALCSEIEETLVNHLGRLGYRISSVTGTYELDEYDDLLMMESDILIATPEKIDLLMRSNPRYFDMVSAIVIDEGHVLGDATNRSALIEFLLVRLKRRLNGAVRFFLISAVMPEINGQEFSQWLCNNKQSIINSPNVGDGDWQPTRRIIGKFTWASQLGRIDYPSVSLALGSKIKAFVPSVIKVQNYCDFTPKKKIRKTVNFPSYDTDHKISRADTAVALAQKFSEDGPVLIFCAIPNYVQGVGNAFLRLIRLCKMPENISMEGNFSPSPGLESLELAEKWMGDCAVTECLRWGIGLHYGSLAEPIRKAIENDYKNKRLNILVATNTLAQGVNLPIKTIIVHSVVRNPQTDDRVSVRDFWNIIGRAGRAGQETEGNIIFISTNYKDEQLFSLYSDQKHIEPAISVIYRCLLELLNNRISAETFEKYIEVLLEPQMIALLVEEAVETPDEEYIKGVINDSLVSIQADALDKLPLVEALCKISFRFIKEVDDGELRKCFAQTGFGLISCKKLLEFIDANIDEIAEVCINAQLEEYIEMTLSCVLCCSARSLSAEMPAFFILGMSAICTANGG
ncbi:MAG: DEAD/DEAH box helicase [Negativicutes bacterium]